MNKYEIEKRCREEMQKSIPDTDALWQRIESRLPEPSQPRTKTGKIERTVHPRFRKAASAAALFLLAAAGLNVYMQAQHLQKSDPDDAVHATDPVPDSPKSDAEENRNPGGLLHYEDLRIVQTASLSIDRERLGVRDAYFSQEDVVGTAGCFVDILVEDGIQDKATGSVTYTMEVVGMYGDGGLRAGDTLTVSSSTAYVLEKGHEYVLPLYREAGDWRLAGECAPQMERTLDGKLVFHSGWYALMDEAAQPLLCDSRGKDDYFYDRMYLTDLAVAEAVIQGWAEEKKA